MEKKCGEFIRQLFAAAEKQTGDKPLSTTILTLFNMVKPENITRGAGIKIGGKLSDGTAEFEIGHFHGGSAEPAARRLEMASGAALMSAHQLFHLSGYDDEELGDAMFKHMAGVKSVGPAARTDFPATQEGYASYIHTRSDYWAKELYNRCNLIRSQMK